MKYITNPFSFLFFFISLSINAQDPKTTDNEVHHEQHNHEIGIGTAPVYFMKEKELSFGLHMHYLYNLPHTKFGLGIGYEKIFDEHKHNSFAFTFSYRPVDKLSFNFSPGFATENNEYNKSVFAVHFETTYEFEIHNFHIGPILEFAADKKDYHISLGLHTGVGF